MNGAINLVVCQIHIYCVKMIAGLDGCCAFVARSKLQDATEWRKKSIVFSFMNYSAADGERTAEAAIMDNYTAAVYIKTTAAYDCIIMA